MTASKNLSLFSILTIGCVFLVACGGGSNNNNSGPNPPDAPNEEASNTSLTVRTDNLQGTAVIDWQGQQFTLDPSQPVAEFSSPNTSLAEVKVTSPTFQTCEIVGSSEEDLKQTVEVLCNAPTTHFLEVTIENLKGELALTWGVTTPVTFIQNQPSLSVSSESADVELPEIVAQPELQTCSGELGSERELNATFTIVCADAESEHIVEIITDIPFPVFLRGTTNIVEITDRSPVTMQGSQIDGISIDGSAGTQFCELQQQGFSETLDKQRWQLSCREYTVHVAPETGVVLTFDDREQHVLQPGDYDDLAITPVSRYNRQLVLSEAFGAKEIIIQEQQVVWQDIPDISENATLIDYLNTDTISYLLYRDSETERYSVQQLRDSFERSEPILSHAANNDAEDQNVLSAELVPVSFIGNEIAYTEIIGNEESRQRRIVGILDGSPIREFKTPIVNDNSFMVGGSHSDKAPFIFQVNDTNPLLDPENRIDMFILGQATRDPIIDRLDTRLKVLNWPDEQNQLRIWAMGKNLLPNGQGVQLAELDIIQVGSGPQQIVWRAISENTDLAYDSMGSDGKLFVINAQDQDLGHRVISMFNQQGPVNLQALSERSGIGASLRTQRSEVVQVVPNEAAAISRTEVTPVNGWVLLFSGEDNSAGELWISNGQADYTFKVRDLTWDIFQRYQLKFAGANMAVLVSDTNEVEVFDFKP